MGKIMETMETTETMKTMEKMMNALKNGHHWMLPHRMRNRHTAHMKKKS